MWDYQTQSWNPTYTIGLGKQDPHRNETAMLRSDVLQARKSSLCLHVRRHRRGYDSKQLKEGIDGINSSVWAQNVYHRPIPMTLVSNYRKQSWSLLMLLTWKGRGSHNRAIWPNTHCEIEFMFLFSPVRSKEVKKMYVRQTASSCEAEIKLHIDFNRQTGFSRSTLSFIRGASRATYNKTTTKSSWIQWFRPQIMNARHIWVLVRSGDVLNEWYGDWIKPCVCVCWWSCQSVWLTGVSHRISQVDQASRHVCWIEEWIGNWRYFINKIRLATDAAVRICVETIPRTETHHSVFTRRLISNRSRQKIDSVWPFQILCLTFLFVSSFYCHQINGLVRAAAWLTPWNIARSLVSIFSMKFSRYWTWCSTFRGGKSDWVGRRLVQICFRKRNPLSLCSRSFFPVKTSVFVYCRRKVSQVWFWVLWLTCSEGPEAIRWAGLILSSCHPPPSFQPQLTALLSVFKPSVCLNYLLKRQPVLLNLLSLQRHIHIFVKSTLLPNRACTPWVIPNHFDPYSCQTGLEMIPLCSEEERGKKSAVHVC